MKSTGMSCVKKKLFNRIIKDIKILENQKNKRTFYELFPPNYIVLGGIILRNSSKFDELFPLNYNVLG